MKLYARSYAKNKLLITKIKLLLCAYCDAR